MAQLAQYMGGFKGRKNLLWISSEFPPVMEPVAGEFGAALVDMSRALDAANVAVYPVEVRSPVPPVPFLPVAPGSEASLPASRKREILEQGRRMQWIAATTGGRVVANRSQLGERLFDLLQQTRFSYDLGFSLANRSTGRRISLPAPEIEARGVSWSAKRTYFAGHLAGLTINAAGERGQNVFDAHEIGLSGKIAPASADSVQAAAHNSCAGGNCHTSTGYAGQHAISRATGRHSLGGCSA